MPTSDAPERLVQEGRLEGRVLRVSDRAVLQRDLEAPGQTRRSAEQLLVEVVAEAPERLGERRARRDAVEQDGQRDAVPAGRDRGAEHPAEQGPVDAESPLPDLRDALPVTGEARRPVRGDVVQARADEPERDDPERHGVREVGVERAARHLAPRDRGPEQHPEGEQEPVPADMQRSRVDQEAARRARDVGEQH